MLAILIIIIEAWEALTFLNPMPIGSSHDSDKVAVEPSQF